MKAFVHWCQLNNLTPMPAAPYVVARFIRECANPEVSRVWEAVREISDAHLSVGLADPTVGGVAAMAMNDLSKIQPPRSWDDAHKVRFLTLPYDAQKYIVETREKQLQGLFTENASLRKRLKEQTDGEKSAA